MGFHLKAVTDSTIENQGCYCLAGLECLLNIIRALRMGSCLSGEGGSPRPVSPCSPSRGIRKRRSSKRKLGSRSSSFEYRKEEPLHRIPGRLFLNGSSDIASLFTQQGKKGTNQDAMIVWENFASRTDTVFCGVFDGHGPFGHMVAKRVRDSLPLKLNAHWEVSAASEDVLKEINPNNTGSMNSEDTPFISADEDSRLSVDSVETDKHPENFQELKESFLKAYKVMDRELRMHTNIDCFCSGTTAVTLIKQGEYLIIGNVGDSRAVLGMRNEDNSLTAVQLTVDLKPNLPAEAERIRKCRGRVFALHDEPEVARVWLPNNDSPGLAMARAFGDFCLKDFGLISVPEVSHRYLTDKDEFVVLATDGIWDVLSNKEVVDIVAAAPTRSSASRALVETAVKAWRYKYPTSKVDDCAVVCLFFDRKVNVSSAPSDSKSKEHPNVENGSEKDPCPTSPIKTYKETPPAGTEEYAKLEEMQSELGIEWSALEGVSRVNTLLNLPRFVPGKQDNQKAAGEPNSRQ